MIRLFALIGTLVVLNGCKSGGAYSFQHFRYPENSELPSEILMNISVGFSGPVAEVSEKTVRVFVFEPNNSKSPLLDDNFIYVAGDFEISAHWRTENNLEVILADEGREKHLLLEYKRPNSISKYSRTKKQERDTESKL
ncbi:hypothetical protein [Roseibacillus persicicus]|uniref:Uncharacterized protein n=1 Tax=Roseibacillus persicicus TaxID=454148 RepID=A0A918U2M9_9BACT|nr:hypothetical protein [Roseibacillus persicicus]GHC67877.1 hypothetical protein GCM10007100_40010 [Roseibacillus persicicus]